jgi:hypothetical protein
LEHQETINLPQYDAMLPESGSWLPFIILLVLGAIPVLAAYITL